MTQRFRTSELWGVIKVTDMKRVTVSIPEEIDKKILELRKEDRFIRCSYGEIVRQVLLAGLEAKTRNAG